MEYFKLKNLTTVASRILGGKLVEDGIEGQPLVIRTGKSTDFIQTYGMGKSRSLNAMVCRPIHPGTPAKTWAPSFVDEACWAQMLTHLRPGQNFWDWCLCVVKDESLDLTTSGIISMDDIAKSFRENDLVGTPVRIAGGNVYFFDDDLLYRSQKEAYGPVRLFPIRYWPVDNMSLWQTTVTRLVPGMTFEECIGKYLEAEWVPPKKSQEGLYTEFELLVQKIGCPMFERNPENPKTNTVDRIRVEVALPRYRLSKQELREAVKAHKPEIDRAVINRIIKSKRFQKYGVPINCFRLSNCTLRADRQLEYLFELKEVRSDVQGLSI